MTINRITERLNSLIDMGEKVLGTENFAYEGYVEVQLVQQWRTSCLAFLSTVLGHDSIHYHEFEKRCNGYTVENVKKWYRNS